MVLFIAEIGVNHNGSVENAKKLIEAAASAKADYVKFQLFKAELMCSKNTDLADYQKRSQGNKNNMYDLLKDLELSYKQIEELKDFAIKSKIKFLCTSFDEESTKFLNSIGQNIWKIPSGEITNFPYLKQVSKCSEKVFLSTGMSDFKDIDNALEIIKNQVSLKDITILHCTSEYPTKIENTNLSAINIMKNRYPCDIGYSDHTIGNIASIVSIAYGAKLIEKHITLDNKLKGPDHSASLNASLLPSFINDCKNAEKSIGINKKEPTQIELINRKLVRKSIVARVNIGKGEIFTEKNLTTMRPGDGLSPMLWNSLLGKTSNREFSKDEQIIIN